MLFQDLQNAVLGKCRLLGINWGDVPTNNSTSFITPYQVNLFLNIAYNEFLSRTKDYPVAAIQVSFQTQANVNSYPLNPIPAFGTYYNPAALRVYEFVYQTGNAQSRRVPQFSTARFRAQTNQYQNRFGAYSSYPAFWTQLFGRPQIDIWPGSVNANDLIHLTICPDPMKTGQTVVASLGGMLVNPTDEPLIPSQFQMALVYWAVAEICDSQNKPQQQQTNLQAFEKLVNDALLFGAAFGEGDPEQTVISQWDGRGI
jgi:hypothetical protein